MYVWGDWVERAIGTSSVSDVNIETRVGAFCTGRRGFAWRRGERWEGNHQCVHAEQKIDWADHSQQSQIRICTLDVLFGCYFAPHLTVLFSTWNAVTWDDHGEGEWGDLVWMVMGATGSWLG